MTSLQWKFWKLKLTPKQLLVICQEASAQPTAFFWEKEEYYPAESTEQEDIREI